MIKASNIFKVLTRAYTGDEPKRNGKFDVAYAMIDKYPPKPKETEMAFFTDTSICSGCKACEVACKQWNQLKNDSFKWSGDSYDNTGDLSANNWRHVKFIERFPEENNLNRPAPKTLEGLLKEAKAGEWLLMSDQCKHCQVAPCHEACPTGAIMRNQFGGVYYQTDICMGCKMCIAACPFGVPAISDEGHSMKCAECLDRLEEGLEPACVTSCTTGAIRFGPREKMAELARNRLQYLHDHGHPEANLYGLDPFPNYSALNSFYLLMDKPSVYGLPEEPTRPALFMAQDYLRGAAALIICGSALVACMI